MGAVFRGAVFRSPLLETVLTGHARRGHCGGVACGLPKPSMAVRPSRAAHHPCKLLFGHKQRTLAGTATAKCACIISGLNDSTSAPLSPKLRSCTILFTQSIHLSFLLRLVLEVLRNKKKKALIILLDCQQFFSTEKDTQHNIPNVHRSRTTVQLNSRHVQKVYENPKKRC
jgi:hypothetical protein